MTGCLGRGNPICAKINGTLLNILIVTSKLVNSISVNLLYQGNHNSFILC